MQSARTVIERGDVVTIGITAILSTIGALLATDNFLANFNNFLLLILYHTGMLYVFDWGWADAYRRYGRRYYPKLVAAEPSGAPAGAAAGRARRRLLPTPSTSSSPTPPGSAVAARR